MLGDALVSARLVPAKFQLVENPSFIVSLAAKVLEN
jgi:hypothetical protein